MGQRYPGSNSQGISIGPADPGRIYDKDGGTRPEQEPEAVARVGEEGAGTGDVQEIQGPSGRRLQRHNQGVSGPGPPPST